MKRVIIESPYAGDIARNIAYARMCVLDSLRRGEAPIASHLLYTQPGILLDTIAEDRTLGMQAGHAWLDVCDEVAFYVDLGTSKGMYSMMSLVARASKIYDVRRLAKIGESLNIIPANAL